MLMALLEERKEYLAKWRSKNRDRIRKKATEWRLKQGMNPNRYYRDEEIKKITSLYLEGRSLRELGEMFGRDRGRMKEMLVRNGIKTRNHKEAQSLLRIPHPKRCGWRLQEWRNKVIQRDGKCTQCGSVENLEAHHLIRKVDDWRKAYDVTNGVTLCHKCHKKTDTYGKKTVKLKR